MFQISKILIDRYFEQLIMMETLCGSYTPPLLSASLKKKQLLSKQQLKKMIKTTINEQQNASKTAQENNNLNCNRKNNQMPRLRQQRGYRQTKSVDAKKGFQLFAKKLQKKKLRGMSLGQKMGQKYGVFKKLSHFLDIDQIFESIKQNIQRLVSKNEKEKKSKINRISNSNVLQSQKIIKTFQSQAQFLKEKPQWEYFDQSHQISIRNFSDLYKLIGLRIFHNDKFLKQRQIIKNIQESTCSGYQSIKDVNLNSIESQKIMKIVQNIREKILEGKKDESFRNNGISQSQVDENFQADAVFQLQSVFDLIDLLNISADLIVGNKLNASQYRERIKYIRSQNKKFLPSFHSINEQTDPINDMNAIIKRLQQPEIKQDQVSDKEISQFIKQLQSDQMKNQLSQIYRQSFLLIIMEIAERRKKLKAINRQHNHKKVEIYDHNEFKQSGNTLNLKQEQKSGQISSKFGSIREKQQDGWLKIEQSIFAKKKKKLLRASSNLSLRCNDLDNKQVLQSQKDQSFNKESAQQKKKLVKKKAFLLQQNLQQISEKTDGTKKLKKLNLNKCKENNYKNVLIEDTRDNTIQMNQSICQKKQSTSFNETKNITRRGIKKARSTYRPHKKLSAQKYHKQIGNIIHKADSLIEQNKIAWRHFSKYTKKSQNKTEISLQNDGQIKIMIREIQSTIMNRKWNLCPRQKRK